MMEEINTIVQSACIVIECTYSLLSRYITFICILHDSVYSLVTTLTYTLASLLKQPLIPTFLTVWEVRHGSLMALREILSVQATSAGVMASIVEVEAGSEAEVPNDMPVSERKESEKEITASSPRKENMIDLNLDISEEDNGEFKKPKEPSSPMLQNHNWTGLPEVINSKPDWMIAVQNAVKTELSLGDMKPELKLGHVKPEGLDALNSGLSLDLGNSQDLGQPKPELNLDLGIVKPELSLGGVKQELELDLNMEVTEEPATVKVESAIVKEELVIVKEEPSIVNEELLTVKEEKNIGRGSQSNLFWHPHDSGSDIKEANDSKVVSAAKKAWAANIGFLQDCTIRLLCIFALDR